MKQVEKHIKKLQIVAIVGTKGESRTIAIEEGKNDQELFYEFNTEDFTRIDINEGDTIALNMDKFETIEVETSEWDENSANMCIMGIKQKKLINYKNMEIIKRFNQQTKRK